MKLSWIPFRFLPRFYSSAPHFEVSVPTLLSEYRNTPFTLQDGLSEWKGNGGLLLLHQEDKLLGLLQMQRYRTFWELSSFVLGKEYQGLGFGRKMLKYCVHESDVPVWLRVKQDNPAQELYRSVGFSKETYSDGRFLMKYMK